MALTTKGKRRLETLIKFIATLPASANKHFNMDGWFRHDGGDHDHHLCVGDGIKQKHLHECGTTACALGWGCMVPSFRKAGLRLFKDGTGVGEIRFGEYVDGDAAMKFFEINYDHMVNLFGADNKDSTPKQWAKRARTLLRKWAKTPA